MSRMVMVPLLAAGACTAAAAGPLPVQTVEYESPAVGRTLKYNICLPRSYDEQADRRFPVLYLLHGLTSNYTHWAPLGAPRAAAEYDDLIVVMPDAGNSWYVNWAESAEGQANAWEDAIVKDLVGHVDAHYRTIAAREGRAINGLSMGGYGAMTLGLRNPETFCSVGSHSGVIGLARMAAARLKAGDDPKEFARRRAPSGRSDPAIGLEAFDDQEERTPKGLLFVTAEQAEAHDPFRLVVDLPREKLPHLYLDCGTDDGLLSGNQEFARLLMEKKIPFTFAESAGGHAPPYWARTIHDSMAVQHRDLTRELEKRSAVADPSPAAAKE